MDGDDGDRPMTVTALRSFDGAISGGSRDVRCCCGGGGADEGCLVLLDELK